MPISETILIIASNGRIREGLRVLLKSQGFEAVMEAQDWKAGLRMIAEHSPSLVLLDAGLPGDQTWQMLSELRGTPIRSRCLVLTQTPEEGQRALRAGAGGALPLPSSGTHLVEAIRALPAPSGDEGRVSRD